MYEFVDVLRVRYHNCILIDVSKMLCVSYISSAQRRRGETSDRNIQYAMTEIEHYISTANMYVQGNT